MKRRLFESYSIKELEREAIEFIKHHEPKDGYFLGFSGGKDSCVIKRLAIKAKVNFQSYYSSTRIDPPEIIKFIKRHHGDVIWKFPKRSFWSYLLQYGYPTMRARWCCSSLKKTPTRLTQVPLKHRILGIRAEESSNRSRFPRISSGGNSSYTKGQIVYKPIFYWPEWAIWDYIEEENIPICSLYDEGFERIGCMVCPMICNKNKVLIKKAQARWPHFYKVFEKTMKKLYDNHKRLDSVRQVMSFEEFLEAWYTRGKILGDSKVCELEDVKNPKRTPFDIKKYL